jgi:hypothetical protein
VKKCRFKNHRPHWEWLKIQKADYTVATDGNAPEDRGLAATRVPAEWPGEYAGRLAFDEIGDGELVYSERLRQSDTWRAAKYQRRAMMSSACAIFFTFSGDGAGMSIRPC